METFSVQGDKPQILTGQTFTFVANVKEFGMHRLLNIVKMRHYFVNAVVNFVFDLLNCSI